MVAIGSSLPEIATSIYAAAYGSGNLVVGHIVGSATSQITIGLGVVALAPPLTVARQKTRVYGAGMLAAMAIMAFVLRSGAVTRFEGTAMVAIYVVFLAVLVEHEDYAERVVEADLTAHVAAGYVLLGLVLVIAGGHLLVTGGESLALETGVPSYLVGLVTGLGTTTPEIAVALIAMRRDRGGIAIGALLGSNITDSLFSLGIGAAVAGVQVTGVDGVLASVAYMTAASAGVLALVYSQQEIGRRTALACIVLYVPTLLLG